MKSVLSFIKKVRQLYNIKDYVIDRISVSIKFIFKFKPNYQYEKKSLFDNDTKEILNKIKKNIPNFKKTHTSNRWTNINEKENSANEVIKRISSVIPHKIINGSENVTNNIKEFGFAALNNLSFDKNQSENVIKFLNNKYVFPSHVPWFSKKKKDTFENIKKSKSLFASYDLNDFLSCIPLIKLISSPHLINIVSNYFGCLPTINNVNLYWTFCDKSKLSGPLNYHRDVEDHKIVNFFLLLTETKKNDGSHCYVEKTHNLKKSYDVFDKTFIKSLPDNINPIAGEVDPEKIFNIPFHGYGNNKFYETIYKNHLNHLCGAAGNAFITDGYGLHKSCAPLTNDRLILWVTFSLTTSVYENNNIPFQRRLSFSKISNYISNSKENKFIYRNIIDFLN